MFFILLRKIINFTHNRQVDHLLKFMTRSALFIIVSSKRQTNQIFFFDIEILYQQNISHLQGLLTFFPLYYYSSGKLKLTFTSKKLSLLRSARRTSCFIVFTEVLSQINDIGALNRLMALEAIFMTSYNCNLNWWLICKELQTL